MNRLWVRYNYTGNTGDTPRSDGRRATAAVQVRYIRLMHVRDRFRTAASTASHIRGLRRISSQTAISHPRQAGHQARRPVRRNVLTAHHHTERLRRCQELITRRRAQWRTVLVSDKSRFMLFRADGLCRIFFVIINVIPPIVFWNMIVSVVVASWCLQRFAMMIVLPW